MINNEFYRPLFTVLVLVLILLLIFSPPSWAVKSTPEQTSQGKTAVLKTPETTPEMAKSPKVKNVTLKTSKTKPVSPQPSKKNPSVLTASGKKKPTLKNLNRKEGSLPTPEPKTAEETFAPPETIIYPILMYQIPRPQRILLDNGMILFLLEDHELPLVRISALVRTGSAYDPPGKAGLAELACRAMRTGGTTALTGDAIDDRLDHYAISIWANADTEMSSFGLSTLKENLEMGLDLFSQILKSPRFDPPKVQTEKDLLTEGLRRIEDDPQEYAFREFRKHLYRGNPRGNQKTIASVDKIQASDLAAFHRQYFSPGSMMISVTGDITREEAVQLLSKYFEPSPPIDKPVALPAPLIRGDGKVILVPKETPQSIVLMGFSAPSKKSPDYFSFSILDFILGSGGFRSRIFQEIRNNQGLAYSAGSFYKAREDYGVLSTYAMTKADTTMKVLEATKSILAEVGNSPLKAEEINWAKKSITNNFLFSFISAEQITYQQMMIEYEGLPADFLEHYRDNVQKVKTGDIQSLAKTYLRPDQATVLILGEEKRFDRPANASDPAAPGN
jgi:predicted Zn-dependent peptidase